MSRLVEAVTVAVGRGGPHSECPAEERGPVLRYLLAPWWWPPAALAAWYLAALAAGVGIPRVSADLLSPPGPMEQLGTFATALAVVTVAVPLREPLPWSLAVSPRSAALIRLLRLVTAALVTCVGATVSGVLLPVTVLPAMRLWGVVLWGGLHLVVRTVASRRLAVLLPLVVAAVVSVQGMCPWEWNLVYNVDALGRAVPVAVGLLASGSGVWLWAGDADDRRAVAGT